MRKVLNFSAGPAMLLEDVLKEVQAEMLNFEGTVMSIVEMSHRSKTFEKVLDDAINDLKDILKVPDNYKIIFVQGGASLQFSAIPLNLMKNKKADYILSGLFSEKAYKHCSLDEQIKKRICFYCD